MKNLLTFVHRGACRHCAPLLVGYMENQLDINRRNRIEAHLAICLNCQHDLAAARKLAQVLNAKRAEPAALKTDLWSRIEADIRRAPQSAPHVAHLSSQISTGRLRAFGDCGWGQALPVAAAIFAAGVLVTAAVDATNKKSDSAAIAVNAPSQNVRREHLIAPTANLEAAIKSGHPTDSSPMAISSLAAPHTIKTGRNLRAIGDFSHRDHPSIVAQSTATRQQRMLRIDIQRSQRETRIVHPLLAYETVKWIAFPYRVGITFARTAVSRWLHYRNDIWAHSMSRRSTARGRL